MPLDESPIASPLQPDSSEPGTRFQWAADQARLMAAKHINCFDSFPGSYRIQRWLAPQRVVGRNPSVKLMRYPFGPSALLDGTVRWEGTTEHFIGWNAHFRGAYEPETLAVTCDLVGQGMRMIEVGANEGYHTVFAGWCAGPSGLVHAYEPYVHARAWLERNVARLGWGSRVRVHSAAVGAGASGSATLFVPAESAENQGVAGLRISSELQTGQALVDVVRLDAEHDTERIAFIKMDVQGGEAEVIHGAKRLLRRCQPALYFEVGDAGLMTAIPAAEEHGYVVQRVFPFSRKPFYSLSDEIAGRWYGNCLAIHRDRLEEFEATRGGGTALRRRPVGPRTETLESGS
jgi:FkbM family methyltransferase